MRSKVHAVGHATESRNRSRQKNETESQTRSLDGLISEIEIKTEQAKTASGRPARPTVAGNASQDKRRSCRLDFIDAAELNRLGRA